MIQGLRCVCSSQSFRNGFVSVKLHVSEHIIVSRLTIRYIIRNIYSSKIKKIILVDSCAQLFLRQKIPQDIFETSLVEMVMSYAIRCFSPASQKLYSPISLQLRNNKTLSNRFVFKQWRWYCVNTHIEVLYVSNDDLDSSSAPWLYQCTLNQNPSECWWVKREFFVKE